MSGRIMQGLWAAQQVTPEPGHAGNGAAGQPGSGDGRGQTLTTEERLLKDGIVCESYGPWLEFGWSPLLGLRDGRWKFIEAPEPELYDLSADPGEIHNLAAERPAFVAAAQRALRGRLAALRAAGRGTEAAGAIGAVGSGSAGEWHESARGATPEEMERLQSLGYVASPLRQGSRNRAAAFATQNRCPASKKPTTAHLLC